MTEKCFVEQLQWVFSDKSFNSVHKQTNLVIEKVAAKFKGCLLAEWIKMLAEDRDANYIWST